MPLATHVFVGAINLFSFLCLTAGSKNKNLAFFLLGMVQIINKISDWIQKRASNKTRANGIHARHIFDAADEEGELVSVIVHIYANRLLACNR